MRRRERPEGGGDVLLDHSLFQALIDAGHPRHPVATAWLAGCHARLNTTGAVLAETAAQLGVPGRAALADLAEGGALRIHHPDADGYRRMALILRKYAELDLSWASASLVWAAEHSGIARIASTQVQVFSTCRINGRSKFLLEPLA